VPDPAPAGVPELDGRPVTLPELQALALTGYGHLTSMRVEDGGVRGLGLHLERLVRDCRELFGAELDPGRVRRLVRHALEPVARPVVARVTVFDPALDAGRIGADAEPHVLVTTRSAPDLPAPPVRVGVAAHPRESPAVKHVGTFGALRQRRIAQRAGFDDVLLVDHDGRLTELATSNVGLIIDDRVVWPAAAVLPGVTVALIERAHAGPVTTEPVRLDDLGRAQAAFALNAVVGVRAIAGVHATGAGGEHRWDHPHALIGQLQRELAAVPPDPL
jgi:branched-subunit amino acid aminotransferase/4-amino-4-deoxychorismate lyase